MNELLTVREAMKILKVSHTTLYSWFSQGRLRAFKIGRGSVRVKKSDLEKLMVLWKPGKRKFRKRGEKDAKEKRPGRKSSAVVRARNRD